jgi:poly-beta-1,6-N-acetyl-D-glucosamine synthase
MMNTFLEMQQAQWLMPLHLFSYYYPLLMAHVWTAGAIVFYGLYERNSSTARFTATPRHSWPMVSIVVPCYNEEDNVNEVIGHLLGMDYPNYEIIAINDGSRDRTGGLLDALARRDKRVRVIHQAKNQGKAVALITAATVARSEYLVCIDGDALLAHDSLPWMMRHFLSNPAVAAVTGNPRIRTRSTMLGRLQVGEFSSIIGLIKRAQSTYGRIYSVSGVITAFRRSALHDIGYWSVDMMCEDIDITWKLQVSGWLIRYEPHALCWILMPETLKGLWKQRLRWAMGGIQVLLKYSSSLTTRQGIGMLPLYIEYVLSVSWAYVMTFCMLLTALSIGAGLLTHGAHTTTWASLLPAWSGLWLATVCLMQMFISLMMDRRYEKNLLSVYATVIWYPIAFWMLTMLTTVWALPMTLMRKKGQRARWVSPDRGYTGRTP